MYMVAGKETTQEDPFNSKYTGDLYEFTFSKYPLLYLAITDFDANLI